MAKKSPETLRLPHVRASDYRQIYADGALVRVDGDDVVLTFFINDSLAKEEILTLLKQDGTSATYGKSSVDEARQRTDLVAIRTGMKAFLNAAATVAKRAGVQQIEEDEEVS